MFDLRLTDVNRKIADIKRDIAKQELADSSFQTRIDDIEQYKETSEKYNEIKSRIKTLNDKLVKTKSFISENYNIKLLDDLWILLAFPDVFAEYRKKVAEYGKLKRKLDKEFIEERAKEKGKKEAIEELTAIANGAVTSSGNKAGAVK